LIFKGTNEEFIKMYEEYKQNYDNVENDGKPLEMKNLRFTINTISGESYNDYHSLYGIAYTILRNNKFFNLIHEDEIIVKSYYKDSSFIIEIYYNDNYVKLGLGSSSSRCDLLLVKITPSVKKLSEVMLEYDKLLYLENCRQNIYDKFYNSQLPGLEVFTFTNYYSLKYQKLLELHLECKKISSNSPQFSELSSKYLLTFSIKHSMNNTDPKLTELGYKNITLLNDTDIHSDTIKQILYDFLELVDDILVEAV